MSGTFVHSICELHNRIRRDPAPATSNELSRLVTRDFPEPPEFVAHAPRYGIHQGTMHPLI